MMRLRPHTPRPNPVETEWREAGAATEDTSFGCPDKMRDAIIRMPHNGEMPIANTFE